MAQKSYKLLYFPARGRGEFIRLAFIIAGVEFEDCRIEKETWATLKAGEFGRDFTRSELYWFCFKQIKWNSVKSWFKPYKFTSKHWVRGKQVSCKLRIKLQTHNLLKSRGGTHVKGTRIGRIGESRQAVKNYKHIVNWIPGMALWKEQGYPLLQLACYQWKTNIFSPRHLKMHKRDLKNAVTMCWWSWPVLPDSIF